MFHPTAVRRSFEAALRDLDDRKAKARAGAARDLAAHADEHRAEVTERLTRALQGDDSPEVRAAAAEALADAEATEAVPELIAAAGPEEKLVVRQMALTALGELGDRRAEPVIRQALKHSAAALRFQAVMAFVRSCDDHDEAVQVLVDGMADPDPLVCHIALRMAEELGDERAAGGAVAEPIVREALELLDHESPFVQVAAAIILARSDRDDGDELLAEVAAGRLVTREAADEAAAIELCGRRRLRQAEAGLELRAFGRRFSLKRDPFVWHARVALAAMDHRKATTWILAELDSRSRERRILAAAAAGRAGVHGAGAKLEALLERAEGVDRDVVAEALAALRSQQDRDEEGP